MQKLAEVEADTKNHYAYKEDCTTFTPADTPAGRFNFAFFAVTVVTKIRRMIV